MKQVERKLRDCSCYNYSMMMTVTKYSPKRQDQTKVKTNLFHSHDTVLPVIVIEKSIRT